MLYLIISTALMGQWQDAGTWNLPQGTVFSWQWQEEDRGNSTLYRIKVKLEGLSPNAKSFGVKGVGVAMFVDRWNDTTLGDDAILVIADQWYASKDMGKLLQSGFAAGAMLAGVEAGILPELGNILQLGQPTGTEWRTATEGDSKTFTINLDPSDVYVSEEDFTYLPGEFITVIWIDVFEDIAFAPDNHATYWVSLYEPWEEE